jgi:hypothetical protein
MAVAYIMDFPGGSAEDYEAVIAKMQLRDTMPPGGLFHAAGPTDEGWRVCDVWESAEQFQQFADAKIGPLTAEQGMAPPRMRSFAVNQIRRGAQGPVTFVQVVRLPGIDAESFAEMDTRITGPERQAPEGCVFHVNGMLDGEWCVLDYWTSKDIRDAFIAERVRPAFEAAGVTAMPQFEEMAVHNVMTAPAEHTAGV